MMKPLTLASPTVTQPKGNWWNWRECTDGTKKRDFWNCSVLQSKIQKEPPIINYSGEGEGGELDIETEKRNC